MVTPKTSSLLLIAFLLLAALVPAQVLTVTPQVPPGGAATVTLTNSSATSLHVGDRAGTRWLRVFGEAGEVRRTEIQGLSTPVLAPSDSWSTTVATASTPFGPLVPGFYFVEMVFTPAGGATRTVAARFQVGSPSGPAPSFFVRFGDGLDVHAGAGPGVLRVTNATPFSQTFPPSGWILRSLMPGVALPPTAGTFPALFLPPQGSVDLAWPGSAHLGFTEQLEVVWIDPALGPVSDTVDAAGPIPPGTQAAHARLYRPEGNEVPLGAGLPLLIQSTETPVSGGHDVAALLLAFQPGAIPLPGGAVLPLAADPLLIASVTGAIAAGLPGSPAAAAPLSGLPWPGPAGACALLHPGPAVSGLSIIAAGVAYTPGETTVQATAAHLLRFE